MIDLSSHSSLSQSGLLTAIPMSSYHQPPVLPRPSTPPGKSPASATRSYSRLSFGVVCSSNINRSMEAHLVLGNAGLIVESYGTGTNVRLPGRSAMEPRIFKFGTPYEDMFNSMAATAEDEAFFNHNGVLQLSRRGAAVKVRQLKYELRSSTFTRPNILCMDNLFAQPCSQHNLNRARIFIFAEGKEKTYSTFPEGSIINLHCTLTTLFQ